VANSKALKWYLVAVGLVVLRCLPSLAFEQFDFDSDQAVVGLMAKHLVEARAFPLFFYGQNYMLGVQAWIAAPFIAAGGATVLMLRLPLLLINIAVVVWLMREQIDRGVRPGFAFAATLPLIAPGALGSMLLMQTLGASIEPFFYVLLLWHLRRRPIAFGVAFCLAYLHREFVLFALPAMVVVWLLDRPVWSREIAVSVAKALGAFAAVWIAVAWLAQHVNTLGPSGGDVAPASLVGQSQMVLARLVWDPHQYAERLTALVRNTLPDLFALHPVNAIYQGVNSRAVIGSSIGAFAFALALVAATLGFRPDRFSVYLGLIAVETILAYALNGGIHPDLPGVPRYVLLAMLLPTALLGACMARPNARVLKVVATVGIAAWAAFNVRDSVTVLSEYLRTPPPSEYRVLADFLVGHRIRYGRADYWDAYIVDFLSRERVILAPTAVMRISSYDARVNRNTENAVDVLRQPCDRGVKVVRWCVDDPLHR